MRITAKIATAGVAGLSRFPVANYTIDECTAPDGRLDPAKTRRALDVEQVQIGSKDDLRVLAFTLESLTQQRSVVEKMAKNLTRDGIPASVSSVSPDGQAVLDPARSNYRTEAATPGDRRCERNMKRDRVAYVRTDVTGCADGIHVKLSVMNPRDTVGNAISFARDYAVMCARILIYLREAITTARIVLIEGEGAQGVYADAEAMNRRDDLAKLRASCDRLHNGSCSPCKFDCPLYMNGKCKDPMKEDPKLSTN